MLNDLVKKVFNVWDTYCLRRNVVEDLHCFSYPWDITVQCVLTVMGHCILHFQSSSISVLDYHDSAAFLPSSTGYLLHASVKLIRLDRGKPYNDLWPATLIT